MKKLTNYFILAVFLLSNYNIKGQCTLNLFATPNPVVCGECVTLSAFGSMNGNVAFQEDFNSGSPVGWQFTQTTTIANNTCGVPSPDGTDFMWMGDASVNPRDMTTVGFDLTLGGTVCFEMRYSIQADASPCEGPDEPDEGVYLQYSTNGGASWITIQYWDPNGGNDPSLTGWNQYCAAIPAGAMTANTMIQWHQDAVSGAEYDHWGIDNVIITLNDPNSTITWLHDGYSYPMGSSGGDDPTQVCLRNDSTFTAQITNGVNTCTQNITVTVVDPVLTVIANTDSTICTGECVQLVGEAKVVTSPSSTPTFENNEFSVVTGGSADMNINVTGLNQTTLTSSSITEVCLTGFNFSGTQLCTTFGGCNCNGAPIAFGATCSLNISSFDVILTTPNGCQITLVPNGIATGTNYTNVCFVPSGGGNIAGGGFPTAGTWNPNQPFSNLNGCTSNGVWNLEVNAPGGLGFGVGTLQGWSISFDDPEISYPAAFTWTPTTDMTNSTTLTPTVCPVATQTYTLEATDVNNCVIDSDPVTITVSPCVNCSISALTAIPGACQSATNTYTVNGDITFTNAPATGTLTVTDCHGNSQVFNAPFTSPQAYSIAGITSNGVACNVTAVFSADAACTLTTNYVAPSSCLCSISALTADTSSCNPATNTYGLSGQITFTNAPAAGTLTVTDCNGNNQVFNAPFTSPQAYSLTGLPSNGGGCNITAVFSANAACTLTTNFTAPAACTPNCSITGITVNTTACDASGEYTTSGQISFTNPPASGNLIIEDCSGIQQTVSVIGLTSPYNYNLAGQTADGSACDITAYFSADATCTQTLAYPAPSCNCNIDLFTAQQGYCDGITNTFELTGNIEFSFPPATGTLTITADNGTTTYDTIINAPFTSPQTWSISGIPADGSNITITASFSSDAACTATLNTVAPPDCSCAAQIGTFTTVINGDGQNNYQLCFGDVLEITSNNNYTYPGEATAPPIPAPYGYNPGLGYLLYSCPPTIGTVPSSDTNQVFYNDPCFLGVVTYGDDYDVVNNLGAVGAPFTNSTIYYVPITFYDTINNVYSYTNTNMYCFSMGSPIAVQYLPQVVSSNPTENCVNGTFTITINGGLPELDGSNFTASNLLPATASFVNTTTTNGGTIQINGLQNGDNYSFDIADANGCPITITGGPFVGLPTANAGSDDTTCTLSYNLNATPSIGTGTWTAQAGVNVAPANSATGTATATAAGTYELYWTESNGAGCTDVDTVVISFSNLSYTTTLSHPTCGNTNGTITVNAIDGLVPYQYSNDSALTYQAIDSFPNLAQGSYDVVVVDALGCIQSSDETLIDSDSPEIDSLSLTQPLCNGDSNGEVVVHATGGVTPYQFNIDAGVLQPDSTFIGLAGSTPYLFTIEDALGCTDTMSTILINPSLLVLDSAIGTDAVCKGNDDGTITIYAQGGTGTLTYSIDSGSTFVTSSVFNGLSPQTYGVVVQDANNCQQTIAVVIDEPLPISIPNLVDSVVCFGTPTGQIQILPQGGISPYTYSWVPSGGTGTIASNLSAGTYTVTVTDANLCQQDSTFTVYEPAQFIYTTTSQNANCNQSDGWAAVTGFTGGTGSYNYQWDAAAANQVTDTAFNLTPGNYDVTITDGNLCDTTITITVGNNPIFTTTITNIINITCKDGTDGSATANGSDAMATYNYTWTNTTPVQNTQTAINLSAGITYYVTIVDAVTNCTVVDSVNLTEPDSVTITSISPNDTICTGQSTTITATATGGSGAGYVYTWDNGLGTGQSQTVSPPSSTTTTYIVTAEDGNGCISEPDTVIIMVHPPLSVQASNDVSICPETSTTLDVVNAQMFGNGGPYTYSWTPNTNMTGSNTQTPTVTPTATTTYTVTLSDNCSPPVTDTVRVSLWNLPPLSASSTPPVCEDDGVITFYNGIDTALVDTTTVTWYFGDGGVEPPYLNWDTVSHQYTQSGTYTVSMSASTLPTLGGCKDTVVVTTIEIYPMPIADFISTPNITSMFEPEIQFADQSGSTIQYWNWDFAGLDTSNYPNPLYIFPDDTNGTYAVTLTVTDINGCVDDITKTVIITGEYGIYIPNAFTPDFDNKNDMFGPKGFGISPEDYHFMIFDRWGEKMFDTDTLFEPWDGFYKGTRVQEEVYVWKLFFKDINNKKHELIGHVTVIQ